MIRIFNVLNKEVNGLHQAAFFLAVASVGAKILAVLRDRLLASSFGAGTTLDVYYASFRIPDALYVFSLFLVSITALIPIILEKQKTSLTESRRFVNGVFTLFFFSMASLLLLFFFLIPCLSKIAAPGFSGQQNIDFINFSRILLLSPFLLGLSNLVSSVIQSRRRFFAYALSGVFYNFGIILGLLFLYPKFGLPGIIWGVVVGAFLHFLIQVPSLISLGYFPYFVYRIDFLEIKNLIILSFPRTLGLTLNQIVLMVVTALASFLAAGSIAVFNLASNLQAIPLGIIALSYSVAAFPSLAANFLRKEKDKFISDVVSSFRHIIFWLVPFSVLLIVLRAQIVRVILGAGAFTWTDTRLTAAALALFAASLFAQGLILLLVRAFYAAGKTKVPLAVNIISSLFIISFSLGFIYVFENFTGVKDFFSHLLRVEDVSGVSVLALPLAYSLGSILNFLFLFLFFGKEFGSIIKYVGRSFSQILSVSLIMGFITYFSLALFGNILNLSTFIGIFLQGFFAGIVSLIFAYSALRFLKNQELYELTESLKKKFQKKPAQVVPRPEPEELP